MQRKSVAHAQTASEISVNVKTLTLLLIQVFSLVHGNTLTKKLMSPREA